MGDIKTIVSISVFGVVGLLALVGALKGLSRGIKRQSIRTATIILSIILSFVAVKVLYGVVLGFFNEPSMLAVLEKIEGFGLEIDAETKEVLADFSRFPWLLSLAPWLSCRCLS